MRIDKSKVMFSFLPKKPKAPAVPKPHSSAFKEAEEHLDTLLHNLITGDAPFNQQNSCPLFQIPGEIRNHIFSYVVMEHNGKRAIATTDFWYRPNFTHYRYIETALLRTCRRVWVETHALPVEQVMRRFWAGGHERRPRQRVYPVRQAALVLQKRNAIKSKHILPCETVQVYIQMFALQRTFNLNNIIRATDRDMSTRHIIMTIRYTDWWWWENNTPLRLDSEWVDRALLPPTLEKLTMELETRQGKKCELDAIVSRKVSKWQIYTQGKRLLIPDPTSPPKTMSYIGTDRPGGAQYLHHDPLHNQPPKGMRDPIEGEMYYYVVTVDFIQRSGSESRVQEF